MRLFNIQKGEQAMGTLKWESLGFTHSTATSRVLVDLREEATVNLLTSFDGIDQEVAQEIKVEFTRICSGGLRAWLQCPKCSRRGSRLYMPPDEALFLCRDCHDLTYRSTQTSKRAGIIDKIAAAQLGVTASEARILLSDLPK